MGAAGDVISHDPVESDGGEQQSEEREPGAELRDQLLLIHQMVHLLPDRLYFENRQIRIDLGQRPPDFFAGADRIGDRQNLQGVSIGVGTSDLDQGKVDHALRRLPGAAVFRIPHNATAQVVRYMRDLEGPHLSPARMQQIQGIKLMPGARGGSDLRGQYKEPLQVLMGVVILVLLIAYANLANFLLAKTISRAREISTRLALGSTRARIVGQILIETLLLSFSGGVLGLLLAFWGTRALINFVVGGATYTIFNPRPDARVRRPCCN